MLIDCGNNTETGWNPGDHLSSLGIKELDLLVVTNYDEDHVSGLPNLLEHVHVKQLLRNMSVSADVLRDLKSEDGMGKGIDGLVDMIREYTVTAEKTLFTDVDYTVFRNSYPDFDDENNLSLALSLDICGHHFLFPGDLERSGWKRLLENDGGFRDAVKQTNVLIASHHGREDGLEPEVFTKYGCDPYWIIISDKGYMYDTQKTVPQYEQYAQGAGFRGQVRKVLTTRNDGHINFVFNSEKWYAE